MNRTTSILTTIVIFAALWFLTISLTPSLQQISQETKQPPASSSNTTNSAITIAGVSATIELNDINSLWQRFSDDSALQEQVSVKTPTIYVIYQNLNSDYSNAKVSIGYDARHLAQQTLAQLVELPTASQESLLQYGQHSNDALLNAWERLDNNRLVEYIIETHEVGNIITSKIDVAYQ